MGEKGGEKREVKLGIGEGRRREIVFTWPFWRYRFHTIKCLSSVQFISVTQSCWNCSDAQLRPHGLQHARPHCPSTTPRVYSNTCPLSPWCHQTISSSVVPYSSCFQSFPASGSFQNESVLYIRRPKYWSFSFSISLSNEYSGIISFEMDWLDFLAVQGTFKGLQTIVQKHQFFSAQLSLWSNSHIHTWLLEKP